LRGACEVDAAAALESFSAKPQSSGDLFGTVGATKLFDRRFRAEEEGRALVALRSV